MQPTLMRFNRGTPKDLLKVKWKNKHINFDASRTAVKRG